MSPNPDLSVVIASFTGETSLRRCLDSVRHSLGQVAASAEILAVVGWRGDYPLESSHPDTLFLQHSGGDVFELRAVGAEAAKGRLVALLEDHVTVTPEWAAALHRAFEQGHQVVGGPVDQGDKGLRGLWRNAYDHALYFVEYGHFMSPWVEGEARVLSGINVAYDRHLLEATQGTWHQSLRENEVHDVLLRQGHRLMAAPDARVESHLEMDLPKATDHLFQGGRHFGRYRAATTPGWRRYLWPLAAPAVPAVLAVRLLRRVLERQPHRLGHLLLAKIPLLILLGSWSLGEGLGYMEGRVES